MIHTLSPSLNHTHTFSVTTSLELEMGGMGEAMETEQANEGGVERRTARLVEGSRWNSAGCRGEQVNTVLSTLQPQGRKVSKMRSEAKCVHQSVQGHAHTHNLQVTLKQKIRKNSVWCLFWNTALQVCLESVKRKTDQHQSIFSFFSFKCTCKSCCFYKHKSAVP